MDQEEIFTTVEGTATFETLGGEVSVKTGDAIRFALGGFQSGRNDSNDEVVAFAPSAPRDTEDVRIPRKCPECGYNNMRAVPDNEGFNLQCPECDAEVEG